MGILDWLGLKRKKKKMEQVQTQVEKPEEEEKLTEWQLPATRVNFMTDSDKLNEVLKGVYAVYDELKPRGSDGNRVSRLGLVLEGMSLKERSKVKRILEDLDIDDLILAKIGEQPLAIDELSDVIKKSYGYTAARLRFLKKGGKVARVRDSATNKYKYARLMEGESLSEVSIFHPDQKTLDQDS